MDNQNNQNNYQQPNYQQPNYQQPKVVAPKNLALCIILSLVTCGIYGYYWLYCLTEDVNTLSGQQGTSGGMVILLSIVTCGIYLWFWLYKQGTAIDQIKTSRGIPSSNSAILYLVLAIVGLSIVSYALMQNEINNLVA